MRLLGVINLGLGYNFIHSELNVTHLPSLSGGSQIFGFFCFLALLDYCGVVYSFLFRLNFLREASFFLKVGTLF